MDLNENYLDQLTWKKGQLIYDIGSDAETFFIVREGCLQHETLIETEHLIKYPVDAANWLVERRTKKFVFKIQDLGIGDFFGHEEILVEK